MVIPVVKGKKKPEGMAFRYRLSSISADISNVETLDSYQLDQADVHITKDGRYLVREPPITKEAHDLYDVIIGHIDIGSSFDVNANVDDDMIAAKLEESFWHIAEQEKRLEDAKRMFPHLKYYIRRNIQGYDILDVMMRDPDIEDILCSAPARNIRVVSRKYSGRFHTLESNVMFADISEMERFIQKIYGKNAAEPTESKPMSVTHMPDGSRISSTFGRQISKSGPIIAIRKFPAKPLTITHMLKSETMTVEMAAYLWTLLDAKAVGLILGVTGSGKTTLLAALASMLNPRWRILTMEDTLEIQIPHGDWARLNTRKSYGMLGEKFDITMRHLIELSLTQRPDYSIVGEIRVSDMDSLFQAVGTGHGGLTSFHSSSAEGALTRMRGNQISEGELALLWFTTHSAVVRIQGTYKRKVRTISQITQNADGTLKIEDVYKYDPFNDVFEAKIDPLATRRYKEARNICGIDDPVEDMKRRVGMLQMCMDTEAYTVEAVFDILGQYYNR